MIISDWRSVPAGQMAPLFEIERRRWLSSLHWDCTATLADIERARLDGTLAGFAAVSGDAIVGWSYHLAHRDTLHLGGLSAGSEAGAAALIEATMNSREAKAARATVAFGYFDAPGIERCLRDRGLQTEAYRYLVRSIDDRCRVDDRAPVTSYTFGLTAATAALFQAAYRDEAAPRPFARSGNSDEWLEYVTQLTFTRGCGDFDARASAVARDESNQVVGAALVSRIAADTMHLAQVAIAPASRGRGLAGQLLQHTFEESARLHAKRITLLVADSSRDARRVYGRLQFVETAQFLMAAA